MTEDEEKPSKSVPSQPGEVRSARGGIDRRRPGRLKHVSPWLIPLLRFKPPAEQVPARQEHPDENQPAEDDDDRDDDRSDDDERDDDDLGIVQGIAFALLLSIPFWVALAVFWYLG